MTAFPSPIVRDADPLPPFPPMIPVLADKTHGWNEWLSTSYAIGHALSLLPAMQGHVALFPAKHCAEWRSPFPEIATPVLRDIWERAYRVRLAPDDLQIFRMSQTEVMSWWALHQLGDSHVSSFSTIEVGRGHGIKAGQHVSVEGRSYFVHRAGLTALLVSPSYAFTPEP